MPMKNDRNAEQHNQSVKTACKYYFDFLCACEARNGEYRLTKNSDTTPFAFCFAIFGYHLLKHDKILAEKADAFEEKLRSNLAIYIKKRESTSELAYDKPFLQLLTFTLSALKILGRLEKDPMEILIKKLIPRDIASDLLKIGALNGIGQSGNLAMFKSILLIHCRDYLAIDTQSQIDTWVELHLKSMNRFGFWGKDPQITHSQFQNGYHQYEIFHYLGIYNPLENIACIHILSLADTEGHFAPYPGGSVCYDYDAVSILTGPNQKMNIERQKVLFKTQETLLKEQNDDGGFAESHKIRPRSFQNIMAGLRHIRASNSQVCKERIRFNLALLHPKHDRIHTHWCNYQPKWDESDLWNSWFRMLTIARIQTALDPAKNENWGFINYPGIGFHSSLR
jgi:hypothetical protein